MENTIMKNINNNKQRVRDVGNDYEKYAQNIQNWSCYRKSERIVLEIDANVLQLSGLVRGGKK